MEDMFGYLATNIVIYIAGFFVGKFAKIDVVFGVTVPRHIQDDGMINELRKDYRRIYGLTAGFLLIAIVITNLYVRELRWLFDGYVFIWFVLTVYLYIIFYKKVKDVVKTVTDTTKTTSVVKKKKIVSAALDNRDNEIKDIYRYFMPSILITILTIITTLIYYNNIPDRVPIHYNILGQVDGYAMKSVTSVFGLVIIEFLVILVLYMTCVVSIKYSRRRIDPRKPETSRLQIIIANQRLVVYIAMMSFLMSISFSSLHLGIFEAVQLNGKLIWLASFAPTIIIIIGMIMYFVTTGIYGDRIKLDINETEKDVEPGLDNDEGWLLGMIYYNKKDSSVFVPKRFGGGFTVNLATLAGQLIMLLIIIIIGVAIYNGLK